MKKTLKIKEICDKGSSNLKQKDVETSCGIYSVYGASGKISDIDFYHQEKEYIAIVKDGSGIGRVSFMPAKSSVIGTMQYILPKSGFDIRYIGYCLQSLNLSKYKQGAAIPHIYFRDYGERIIEVEDDELKQVETVEYLDRVFADIDDIKKKAEEKIAEAEKLFQAALNEKLKMRKGWKHCRLGDVASIVHGRNQKDVIDNDGQYPIYGSGGSVMGYAKEYLCEEGTTILGRKGTINNPLYIDHKFWNVDTAFGIAANRVVNKRFLYYIVKSQDWSKLNSGTTLPSLTQTTVMNVNVCIPSIAEQQSIANELDTLSTKTTQIKAKCQEIIKDCDNLKQAILKQVFE